MMLCTCRPLLGPTLVAMLTVACVAADDRAGAGPPAVASPAVSPPPRAGGRPAAAGDPVDDAVAYLGQLGPVRGQLLIALDGYRRGDREGARRHLPQPTDPLYVGLAPAFAARGAAGFASHLSRLTALVNGAGTRADVEAAYTALAGAIAVNEAVARVAADWSAATDLRVAAYLVRAAGAKDALRVQGAKVVEPHESQDAFGFVQVARDLVETLEVRGVVPEATASARAALDSLEGAWPDRPGAPGTITATAETFAAAAVRIEQAAAGVP